MDATSDMHRDLAAHGYVARRPELLALAGLEAQADGARVLLLQGAPGVGKTALASAYAAARGARLIYALLHSWSDDQELFAGVDVVAAVAGDAERVHRPGVLAVAASASVQADVVVCLDEIDKAPERVEALLLDVLQTGRVPVRPGEHLQVDLARTTWVLTSNDARPLGDALLRRCRRVRMQPLPADVCDEIVRDRCPSVPPAVVPTAAKAARAVARGEGNDALSIQEIVRVVEAIWQTAETADDVREILAQLALREGGVVGEAGRVAAVWGEVCAARRRAEAEGWRAA